MTSGTCRGLSSCRLFGREPDRWPSHTVSTGGEKLTSEANVLGEKRPTNESTEEAQRLLLCWFGVTSISLDIREVV